MFVFKYPAHISKAKKLVQNVIDFLMRWRTNAVLS